VILWKTHVEEIVGLAAAQTNRRIDGGHPNAYISGYVTEQPMFDSLLEACVALDQRSADIVDERQELSVRLEEEFRHLSETQKKAEEDASERYADLQMEHTRLKDEKSKVDEERLVLRAEVMRLAAVLEARETKEKELLNANSQAETEISKLRADATQLQATLAKKDSEISQLHEQCRDVSKTKMLRGENSLIEEGVHRHDRATAQERDQIISFLREQCAALDHTLEAVEQTREEQAKLAEEVVGLRKMLEVEREKREDLESQMTEIARQADEAGGRGCYCY